MPAYRHARIDFDEVTISEAGVGGEQILHTVIRDTCYVKRLTIRHAGSNETVVTLLVSGATPRKLTITLAAEETRQWENEEGIVFRTGDRIAVQSSDVTGGDTYVSGTGTRHPY